MKRTLISQASLWSRGLSDGDCARQMLLAASEPMAQRVARLLSRLGFSGASAKEGINDPAHQVVPEVRGAPPGRATLGL